MADVSQLKTVTDGQLSVTVSEASLYGTLNRARMYRDMDKLPELAACEGDEVMEWVVKSTYPDLLNATVAVEGMPWPPEHPRQLADLPTSFVQKWREAIWEKNPDWNPQAEAQEADPNSTGA